MRSYLFLANGFEEIEAIAPVDIMRRAGMDIKTVSITDDYDVTGANGVTVRADLLLKDTDCTGAEWLICPGGLPGSTNLAACKPLADLLRDQWLNGGKVAAICAAPAMVLGPLGILDGNDVTGYPGTQTLVPAAKWQLNQPVVALSRLITGRAPGAAYKFGLAIVANSLGLPIATQVASGMMVTND